jgi:hypothetical protein
MGGLVLEGSVRKAACRARSNQAGDSRLSGGATDFRGVPSMVQGTVVAGDHVEGKPILQQQQRAGNEFWVHHKVFQSRSGSYESARLRHEMQRTISIPGPPRISWGVSLWQVLQYLILFGTRSLKDAGSGQEFISRLVEYCGPVWRKPPVTAGPVGYWDYGVERPPKGGCGQDCPGRIARPLG